MLARCLTVERPMRDSSPSSTHSTISGALRSRRARNTFSATLCRDVSSDTWWETPSLRSNHVTLKYLSRDNRTARNVLSRWTRTLSWFESRSANSSSSSWWLRRNRRSPSVAHTFTPSAAKHGRVPNKKQCSRQLQCKVPCRPVMSSILPCPPYLLCRGGGPGKGEGAGYISSTLPYTALPHGASP